MQDQQEVKIGAAVRKAMNVVEKPRSATDILIFDTETTGTPDFKAPSESEHQPHIVELCGLRYTSLGELIGVVSLVVAPNGWVIPDEAIAIHGITNEHANEHGSDEALVLAAFMALHEDCSVRAAHNCSFDDRILRIALMRYADEETADAFKAHPHECTALMAKPHCKLPPTEAMKKTNFKNSFKTPNLSEALLHFTGDTHEGAHRAYEDAIACARVYFAIQGIRMPDFPSDVDYLLSVGVDSEGGSHD